MQVNIKIETIYFVCIYECKIWKNILSKDTSLIIFKERKNLYISLVEINWKFLKNSILSC